MKKYASSISILQTVSPKKSPAATTKDCCRTFSAADRDRTGTVSLPRDFKSLASASSATAAHCMYFTAGAAKCQSTLKKHPGYGILKHILSVGLKMGQIMINTPKAKKQKTLLFGLGAVLGIIAFLLIYGVTPLDVTNDTFCRGGFL